MEKVPVLGSLLSDPDRKEMVPVFMSSATGGPADSMEGRREGARDPEARAVLTTSPSCPGDLGHERHIPGEGGARSW